MAATLPGRIGVDGLDPTVRAWSLEQMAPWLHAPLPEDALLAEFARLNATEANVFLFTVADGRVDLVDKPLSGRHPLYDHSLARAVAYQAFLASAVRHGGADLSCAFAVYVGDAALEHPRVPLFAFQKPLGNPSILLPDPDLIGGACCADPEDGDRLAYDAKRLAAIFVGATSGGLVTAEAVRRLSLPRLRAAAFFRDHPDVAFRLPVLVQYDSEETAALLRDMGWGDGVTVPWDAQLGDRFLLSMDGNGATCSRVARALASNSALLKYDSPHVLYYFSGLRPWLHFIPIAEDRDVLDVLAMERREPGAFAHVAAAGRRFAERFLTRASVLDYTAALLRLYARTRAAARAAAPSRAPAVAPAAPPALEVVPVSVHICNTGDRAANADGWAGAAGSGLWIEGIEIAPNMPPAAPELQYRAVLSDGSLTDWMPSGSFCGTRGCGAPLRGFAVRLASGGAGPRQCRYSARFIGGSLVGPLADGALCQTPDNAALEAILVTLAPRAAGAPA